MLSKPHDIEAKLNCNNTHTLTNSIANETAACTSLAGPTKRCRRCGKRPEPTNSHDVNTKGFDAPLTHQKHSIQIMLQSTYKQQQLILNRGSA
jgi:hypothetical protein